LGEKIGLTLRKRVRWRGTKNDPRYLLGNLYHTIPKVWLWKMVA